MYLERSDYQYVLPYIHGCLYLSFFLLSVIFTIFIFFLFLTKAILYSPNEKQCLLGSIGIIFSETSYTD